MSLRPRRRPDDELPFWRRKAMKDMTPAEWESLCDGCGRCCLNKLQEEGTDRTYYTDVGCKLLDGQTCRCTDYANRSAKVKDCVTLTLAQHQPHLMAAADLRLQARGGGEGFVLVASAGVGRPGDGASGRGVGARQGRRQRGRCGGQGFGGSHCELAAEVAEGRQGLGAVRERAGEGQVTQRRGTRCHGMRARAVEFPGRSVMVRRQ